MNNVRLTKIICTLGPATTSPENIVKLHSQGMNIARVNFSHGSQDQHRSTIQMIKDVNKEHGYCIGLLLDTKGAEIRTGDVNEPIAITKGQEVVFSSTPLPAEKRPVIIVNYDKFAHDVKGAEHILLDNGVMSFQLVSLEADGSVIARSNDDGKIGSRRHVNLPGADISLPALMEKDWDDLKLGIEMEMDYVALSFVRTAEEIVEVADFLKKNGSSMRTIAKIETRQAVENIDAIIDASDGIMVARGDLGAEMPYEKIPAVQDMIVRKCRHAGKPVIVATQMLESMIENPMPTRAEVTDIAHACTTRADATMLSGETAMGQHPFASVNAMHKILLETEAHLSADMERDIMCAFGEQSALADAAVSMALSVTSPAILVLTRTGKTARAVSQLRSNLPIVALTEDPKIQRYLQLLQGVTPLLITFDSDPEVTIDHALTAVKEAKILESGQKVVLIADLKTRAGSVHSVHVRTIA
ncbi:MAG TPA: pyruvate kinase [Candidatus Peribacteraceae bacterium]|nr:pyruvate kinase [Candidatus Peribacteraceae bacterium]